MLNRVIFKKVLKALEDARNQLEYCGYGDSWERECAFHDKLPEKLEKAIALGRGELEHVRARRKV
jgi:hypothetical protein